MRARWLEGGGEIDAAALAREGIHTERLAADPATYRAPLEAIKARGAYVAEDEVAIRPDTPGLDAIRAKFADEHHHDEDEVRFVLEGEGIFDIRSGDDRWMRVEVEREDLIVVPRGRHHRFFLGESSTIRCVRLFQDAGGWVPHYRKAR